MTDALTSDERYRLGKVEGELMALKDRFDRHEFDQKADIMEIKSTLKSQDERTERLHRENKETAATNQNELTGKLQILLDDKNKSIGAQDARKDIEKKKETSWGKVIAIAAVMATLVAAPMAWAIDKFWGVVR